MTIEIKDQQIQLRYSFRSYIIYENLTGENFAPRGLRDMIIMFYASIMASKRDMVLTFDEFLDWIDDQPESVAKFSDWFVENVTTETGLRRKDEKTEKPSHSESSKN